MVCPLFTTALTGHAGSTRGKTHYDAFGTALNLTLPGTGNKLLFTGRQLDVDSGLYYYRARYYDPEIGRFISEDPLGFQAGVNFYAYVGNNPINANDPSGKICLPCVTGAFGFVAGAVGSTAGQIISNGGFTDFSFTEVGIAAGVGFVAGAAAGCRPSCDSQTIIR